MPEVSVRPSSRLERFAGGATVIVAAAAQIASGVGSIPWWIGAAVAIVSFATWTAVHVNALDRPRVGDVATGLLVAFVALSVVVALFWRTGDASLIPVVLAAVVAVSPLAAYFVTRR